MSKQEQLTKSHSKTLKHDMELKAVKPDDLKLTFQQSRTHSDAQIDFIVKSINAHDFTNPILCDEDYNILCGVARFLAAKKIKLETIPIRILRGLNEAQKRALIIQDNKLAVLGEWDYDILKEEFIFLEDTFELEDFGFTCIEIDQIYNNVDHALEQSDSSFNENDLKEDDIITCDPVSQTGDLWLIGDHRLLCGSCLDNKPVTNMLDSQKIQMIITDAPYNVKTSGHIRVDKKHREFKMAAGEMSPEEFTAFLNQAFKLAAQHCKNGALFFGFMDWRHIREMMDACKPLFGELKQLITWVKNNGGMGTFYRSQHELIFVYKNGDAKHINNFGLGENGRYRTNVWEYAGVNTFKKDREEELAMHPTVKPVQMIEDALLDCSNRGGLIYDPFLGSGTTMVAAENQGRICYGVELDPIYVDTTIARMERVFGLKAIHAETGENYEDLQKIRIREKRNEQE